MCVRARKTLPDGFRSVVLPSSRQPLSVSIADSFASQLVSDAIRPAEHLVGLSKVQHARYRYVIPLEPYRKPPERLSTTVRMLSSRGRNAKRFYAITRPPSKRPPETANQTTGRRRVFEQWCPIPFFGSSGVLSCPLVETFPTHGRKAICSSQCIHTILTAVMMLSFISFCPTALRIRLKIKQHIFVKPVYPLSLSAKRT